MADELTPDVIANQFYKDFMANKFDICFDMFTKASKKKVLEWTLKDIYTRHKEAAEASKLGEKEVQIMFKRNDPSLIKSFWKHFYQASGTLEIFRYGYFSLLENSGKEALVQIKLVYPNGQQAVVKLKMMKEGGKWRYAYFESGMPF